MKFPKHSMTSFINNPTSAVSTEKLIFETDSRLIIQQILFKQL